MDKIVGRRGTGVKNNSIAEAQLLTKYWNLVFYDPDNEIIYTISGQNLEFYPGNKKARKSIGWVLFGIPPDGDDDEDNEPLYINQDVIDMIVETP